MNSSFVLWYEDINNDGQITYTVAFKSVEDADIPSFSRKYVAS